MYSNSIKNPINYHTAPVNLVNSNSSAATLLRPLNSHHYWAFFKQVELVTGQPLNDSERKMLMDATKIRKLRKRQYFLQESDPCRYIGFITKGAAKTYSINERGHESILSFSMENDLLTDMESFLNGKESGYHIEVLEDLEMIIVDRDQLFSLIAAIPAMNELFRRFQMMQLIECQKRINAALSMTAEERYTNLLATKPNYAQRFSQNMLASYLGVKPETLSRIRKH